MDQATIDRARTGDPVAFAHLTDPHRRELHVHCYRMLGSVTDADDVLQEILLAAWRGLPDFDARSSVRTWLYRIATRRCLNAIRDGKRRPPPLPVPPFTPPEPSRRTETTWVQPYPDTWLAPDPAERQRSREAIELAFIVALQRLPPRQTAAVVLCDVLGFAASDVAAMLTETPTATKGLLQRGRAGLGRGRDADDPTPGSAVERDLARRFAAAYSSDDVDGVVALLTEDAWLRMPPAQHEYHGRDAIAAFLRVATSWRSTEFVLEPTRANDRPAFVCSLGGESAGVVVLGPAASGIRTITHCLDPAVHALFASLG